MEEEVVVVENIEELLLEEREKSGHLKKVLWRKEMVIQEEMEK